MRAIRRCVCLVLATYLAGSASAAEIVVAPEAAVPLALEAVPVRLESAGSPGQVDDEDRIVLDSEIEIGSRRGIEVPSGRFFTVEVASPRAWSPTVVVDPGTFRGPVRLPVYPVRELRFPVRVRGLGLVPDRLEARFELKVPPAGTGTRSPLSSNLRHDVETGGAVECRVEERVAVCLLPAVDLDLRLAASSFAPVYRLDLDVARIEAVAPIVLIPGPSVRGRVLLEDGETPPPVGTVVALGPDGDYDLRGDRTLALSASRTETDEDGFFQFTGVRPGVYRVSTEAPGYAPAWVESVEARPDLEATLLHPLVLAKAVAVEVEVVPATDPWGEPWTLRLSRATPGNRRSHASIEAPADERGRWRREEVAPGDYRLAVEGSNGTVWLHLPVEVHRDQEPLLVEIPVIEVSGTLDFGDEPPMAGALWFGGRSGARRVIVDVDEVGDLSGYLPEPGEWLVEWVPSGEEGLEVVLRPVEVPDRLRVELDLALPRGRITGEVVNESGAPVAGARIDLASIDRRRRGGEAVTDEEGEFVLRWLEPGSYVVGAREGAATSETVQVRIEEDLEPPGLRLVLREVVTVTGRLQESGRPIAGGRVIAWPDLGAAPSVSSMEATSGPEGLFSLEVAAGMTGLNFLAVAPGYGARLGRLALPGGAGGREGFLLEIELDRYGGSLLVERGAGTGRGLLLVHDGSFLLLEVVRQLAAPRAAARQAPGLLEIPNLEPGVYSVCTPAAALAALRVGGEPPEEGCASGVLAPLGELRLRAPGESVVAGR